jgi:hypothetical protein
MLFRMPEAKDMQIREHLRKTESLEEACVDLEGTIGQFRELVMQLQQFVRLLLSWRHFHPPGSFSELDSLRTQTQVAQTESQTAASQSAAMMSLNLKLQSSASKNQAKNIELEIKKMEARETRELLNIVQVEILSFSCNVPHLSHAPHCSPICPKYTSRPTVTPPAAICSSSVWHIKRI